MNRVCLLIVFCVVSLTTLAQPKKSKYTRDDSLFGSNTPQRLWWDVQHYNVNVSPDYSTKTITGKTTITYTVLTDKHSDYLQLDLQQPLMIDSIYYDGKMYINYPGRPYYNEGAHWFIPLPKERTGSTHSVSIVYHGKPREAKRAPWDGGWVWTKDKQGRPWMSVACQGDGASLWYPCKDLWSDEPDNGASLTVNVPKDLVAVGNGRLKNRSEAHGKASFTWEVSSPINAYNIIPYIGNYVSWSDTLLGESGKLDLAYWVLDYELAKATKQFEQVKPTLRALEHWFGPYPFYNDGYKLVQAPYLGMEHQSAVAYGNEFENGYLGSDLSGTGWGLKWDYIIVHETGHEWFGNNVTATDRADMWVHEGFTDYSETLFIDYYFGTHAGSEYTRGLRSKIDNDAPIIADYGVNKEGSGDMYYKGSNLVHTIRQVIDDDEKFRNILRGLNKEFYHQTVTSKQVENYISQKSGKELSKIFDQYLRTKKIPVLEIDFGEEEDKTIRYRWQNVVTGFTMPVKFTNGVWITPSPQWQSLDKKGWDWSHIEIEKDFYIRVKEL